MRTCELALPCDSGLFTPLQLQPARLFAAGFAASARWLQLHAVSHRSLLHDHQVGAVMWNARLEYRAPLRFFDSDEVVVRAAHRLVARGVQLAAEVDLVSGSALVAKLQLVYVPLRLSDDPSLSGEPAPLPPSVAARFRPDEVELSPRTAGVLADVERIEGRGEPLAEATTHHVLGRDQCEVADQWFWPEAANLAGRGRAHLAATAGGAVRRGLRDPLRSIELVYQRPFYLLEDIVLESRALLVGDAVAFVHRFWPAGGPHAAATPNAIALELV